MRIIRYYKYTSLMIFILILGAWLISPYFINEVILPINSINNEDASGIFAAVAALFSALAFGGILITIFIQKQQLDHQKQEIIKLEQAQNINIKLSAYSALLNYYSSNSYESSATEFTSMDIAKKLNEIIVNEEKK